MRAIAIKRHMHIHATFTGHTIDKFQTIDIRNTEQELASSENKRAYEHKKVAEMAKLFAQSKSLLIAVRPSK